MDQSKTNSNTRKTKVTSSSSSSPSPSSSGVHFSWTTVFGASFLFLLISASIIISEEVGGWTKKYTSKAKFSPKGKDSLVGKVAIVTGGNAGIGYYTVLELARNGAHVIATTRNKARGEEALQKIQKELKKNDTNEGKVEFMQMDLSSLDSVENFVSNFSQQKLPLHMLILNAGVMRSPGAQFVGQAMTYGFETTVDGFEQHIGVNHIAHAHLTNLLLDHLKGSAPSRIVSVSAKAETSAYKDGFVFEDWVPPLDGSGRPILPERYEDGNAYGQSKLANILYAKTLSEKLEGTDVTVYSLHPGVILTGLADPMMAEIQRKMPEKSFLKRIILTIRPEFFKLACMAAPDGALTQLYLATAPTSELQNGGYYIPIGIHAEPEHPQAHNETLRQLLWEETQKAISKRQNYKYPSLEEEMKEEEVTEEETTTTTEEEVSTEM